MAKDCLSLRGLVLILSTAVLVTDASAQETPADLTAVLQRLERLERDNQLLLEKLEGFEQKVSDSQISAPAEIPPVSSAWSSALPSGGTRIRRGWIYQPVEADVLFQSGVPGMLGTDGDRTAETMDDLVHTISAETMPGDGEESQSLSGTGSPSPADTLQDQRIAELDKAFRSLQDKAVRKTYPNVTVNGVFQADAGWIHQDSVSRTQYGRILDGSDFRRARLSAKGSVAEQTSYFFQMDFGFFGRPTFTDVWLEQTKVPLFGNVRIGQWKQPFGLETVSSFRYTTFMERSLLFQPFTPFRHLGIGFYDHSDDLRVTWAASTFRTGQDQFGATLSSDGGYGTSERVTWVPSWECKGRNYLHLGAGHFFNAPPGDVVNFRTIPEFFVGANGPGAVGTSGQAVPGGSNGTPFFVATGNLNVPCYNVLGTELLWVQGPLSVQSEVMVNLVSQATGATAVLPGAYAQAGYFLTGEHRPYDRATGTIDRVIPRSNLAFAGTTGNPGLGAWEVAGRWSYLDLNDSLINGGTIMDYTAGLNWYWNPYTKMVFNYVHSISDTPAFAQAQTDLFGVRAQLDF